ncbi:uncharacterized protein LOC110425556 [Herrania umbratica]|uniref:Uncharacterized protein LOC110425556 n=1 Tax=Herrania umbratica TaxID=108875 RepID=A0A6J1B9K7_9ROSI|nr:uncharacterized protein LOC110425556 [Herrania umbratica]
MCNPHSQPATSSPPPALGLGGSGFVAGGIGATIADGQSKAIFCYKFLAWGTSTAIAHKVVDSIFGLQVIKHETVASSEPTATTLALNMNSLANSYACGSQSKTLSDV